MGITNTRITFQFTVPDVTVLPSDTEGAGRYLVNQIKARTASGTDYMGRPFAPYSPAYAKKKGSEIVDLRGLSKSGKTHMIDSITYQTGTWSYGAELGVGIFNDSRNAMIAEVMNEGAVLKTRGSGINKARKFKGIKDFLHIPARPFLYASGQDLEVIHDMVQDSILERLTKDQVNVTV